MRTCHTASPAALFEVILLAAVLVGSGVQPVAAAPAVQWRELRVPARSGHAMVWDSRRGRALMLGGDSQNGLAHASVWKLVRGAAPRWEPVPATGGGPLRREGIAAVYDSLGDRVLVFGGRLDYGDAGSNELWALSQGGQPAWTLLDASAGAMPSTRAFTSLVLDTQYRLVMFGGEGSSFSDSSVWVMPLAGAPLAWQQVPLPGPGPGPRARHGAVYSPVTNRVTVFGGDRVIGGPFGTFDYVNCPATTWELVLDEPLHWVQRASAPTDSVPVPSSGSAFVADRAGETALWFPGDQGFEVPDHSVWRLDLLASSWTRIQSGAGGPGIRAVAAAAGVPGTGEVLVHGGATFLVYGEPGGSSTNTWRFHATDAQPWATVVPIPPPEPEVAFPAPPPNPAADVTRMNWDPLHRRLISWSANGVWTNDVKLDGAWKLDPQGTVNAPPNPDPIHVIDSARRRLLVFGGLDASRRTVPATQLWSWPLDGPGAWSVEPITGPAPIGTWGIQSAYDPVRDRVVVLPSTSSLETTPLSNVHVLELSESPPRWESLPAPGGPPQPRKSGAVAWDEAGDRLILVGGVTPDLSGTNTPDLWTLSLSGGLQWTNTIPPSLGIGRIATEHGLVVDPTLDRLIVLGGVSIGPIGTPNTVDASPLDQLTSLTDLDPDDTSPMIGGGVAMFDAAAERALFWNGTLWEITWPHGSVGVPPAGPVTVGLSLGPPRPNPASGRVTLDVASDAAGEATLEVFDTAGRRVRSAHREPLAPGRTSVRLSLPEDLAPGLYLVRARLGSRTAQVRLAITR